MDSKAKSAIRTAETLGVLLIVALLLFSRCEPDTRLDVAPPAPSLVEKSVSLTHDPSAHFRYVDADADATFRCALDGAHLRPARATASPTNASGPVATSSRWSRSCSSS